MRVFESIEPDAAPSGLSNEDFSLRRSQWIGFGLLGLLVFLLAVLMIQNERETVHSMSVLADSTGTTSNILIAQNESLQLASAFDRWLGGATTGRNLRIRRAELAQPLGRLDNTGIIDDLRVNSEYFSALGTLDDYIEAAHPGFLLPDEQILLRVQSASTLRTFISESRTFAIPGSQLIDKLTLQHIRDENNRRMNQNFVFLIVLMLAVFLNGTLAFSRLRDFRRIRVRMVDEHRKLEETNVALQRVDGELQLRLEQERVDRAEHEWLDSSVRSISSQFKSTIVPDKIAEALVEGLGRAVEADVVLFYSFPNFPMQRLWKQWHQRPNTYFDGSLAIQFESDLFKFAENLLNKKRIVVVSDSHLIDNSNNPLSDLTKIIQMRARSWVVVPLGAGSQVLGYLALGMFENSRNWSAAEIELIQRVVSEVAEVFIQARLFRQSMQIAENDAEVGRLVELDRVKNDFIENMNHELRTPLTSIIGYMDVVMGDVDSSAEPELASLLVAVQRNAIRLQSLIEDMMQLARTDFQHMALDVATVDIGRLLDDVVNSLCLGAEDSGVTLTVELDSPAGDLMVDGDIGQLEQVFVNLVSNAIKFTPRGGTVTVAARSFHAEHDFVEVKVTDTGIGIPPEEFPNMFKRFFRASTATEASIPGFGIGLSLVHSIVREHHGTITFDSAVGKGTVFTVTLPARYVFAKPVDSAI